MDNMRIYSIIYFYTSILWTYLYIIGSSLTFCQYHILPIRLKPHVLPISLLAKCEFLALLAKCRVGKMWLYSPGMKGDFSRFQKIAFKNVHYKEINFLEVHNIEVFDFLFLILSSFAAIF